MAQQSFKQGLFNETTRTVQFGGEYSKPNDVFVAQAVQVPPYKIMIKEREDAGGGWYGPMTTVEKIIDDSFLIIKDNEIIGCMVSPYRFRNIKSSLWPLDYKHVHSAIKKFAEKYKSSQQ